MSTAVAWHNHRRAAHGVISRAQAIAPSSFCLACLTEFHTLTRLYEHLDRDSPICLHKYEFHFEPLHPDVVASNKALCISQTRRLKAQGHGPAHAVQPICKYPGPVLHLPYDIDPACPYDFNIPTVSAREFHSIDLAAPLAVNLTQTDVQSLSNASSGNLPAIIDLKVYFVLHLFSGQRRQDDYQDHLESMLLTSSLPLIVLSIDIVLHLLGDLTNAKSLGLWIDLTLIGLVLAILGGPPCDT